MFKLTVISGPLEGKSYKLEDGKNAIGRQSSNVIRIRSTRVSKVHCVLTVNGDQIVLDDPGSANGTFVNGALVKHRALRTGDRVSIGENVFELHEAKRSSRAPSESSVDLDYGDGTRGGGVVVPLPIRSGLPSSLPALSDTAANYTPSTGPAPVPTDIKGRVLWSLEHYLMPFFYSLFLKHEWRQIGVSVALVFSVFTLSISIVPMMTASREALREEAAKRAKSAAKQIATQNAPFLAQDQETKTWIGSADEDLTIKFALLVDLENRILAPSGKANQYFAAGSEAEVSLRAAKDFRDGREKGIVKVVSDTVLAIEPVKVFDPQNGQNRVAAMAIVAVDVSLSTTPWGTLSLMYANTLVLVLLLGAMVCFVIYRLTLKPLEILNEDIDRVLRGESSKINRDFQFSELNALFDVVEAALQRIPKGQNEIATPGSSMRLFDWSEVRGVLEVLAASQPQAGIFALSSDSAVEFINMAFEDISGIRSETALGQPLASVSRDGAFTALCEDLLKQVRARSLMESAPLQEVFEFGGVNYGVRASGIGPEERRGVVIVFTKEDA